MPAVDGALWATVPDGPLRGRVVHALSYLDGRLLRSVATDQPLRRALGATLAELGRALRGFDDPLVHRPLLWDLAQLPRLRPLLAGALPGSGDRGAVRQARGGPAGRAWPACAPSSCTTTSARTTR